MLLLGLTLVLVGPYVLLTLADRGIPGFRIAPRTRGKVGLSILFLVTGSGHFMSTEAMAQMLPPLVPYRIEIIYATGILEILGSVGIWVPVVARPAGLCLILMLIGILPANVYSALNHVPFGGHDSGPAYLLVRVPFQLLVIAWTYWATEQRWMGSGRSRPRTPAGAPRSTA